MLKSIVVENLNKAYRIGVQEEVPESLTMAIGGMLKAPWKNFQLLRRLDTSKFNSQAADLHWALKDVSFELDEGEVLGVIGRNGAGKSTLLKILSRITEPTSGKVTIKGRVSSLLEVGTGFHPDLSGRENVYLNGTILGMSKKEIDHKFEEIVEFAGVGKFLDTPIKRYSSGMKVRLAFAVAASLDPEILIIDEVLAVGDAEFQKKCLGKMQDVAKSGRTILFVSHDLAAVESLCTKGIVVTNGTCSEVLSAADAVSKYCRATDASIGASVDLRTHVGRRPNSLNLMKRVDLMIDDKKEARSFGMGQRLSLQVSFGTAETPFSPILGIVIKSARGQPVLGLNNRFAGSGPFISRVSSGLVRCNLGDLPLVPGTYSVDLYLGDEYRDFDAIFDAIDFSIERSDYYGTGKLPPQGTGPLRWNAEWILNQE